MPSPRSADPIVAFYQGGHDDAGRTLSDILAWSDDRLESVHDYIQWVFPTRQPSGVNPSAPLVTDATARAFAGDSGLRERLRLALERMLVFYGLRHRGRAIEIDLGRFPVRSRVWLRPDNHNHLRLTRIVQSLAALGLEGEARALQRCLVEEVAGGQHGDHVSRRTAEFWRQAVR